MTGGRRRPGSTSTEMRTPSFVSQKKLALLKRQPHGRQNPRTGRASNPHLEARPAAPDCVRLPAASPGRDPFRPFWRPRDAIVESRGPACFGPSPAPDRPAGRRPGCGPDVDPSLQRPAPMSPPRYRSPTSPGPDRHLAPDSLPLTPAARRAAAHDRRLWPEGQGRLCPGRAAESPGIPSSRSAVRRSRSTPAIPRQARAAALDAPIWRSRPNAVEALELRARAWVALVSGGGQRSADLSAVDRCGSIIPSPDLYLERARLEKWPKAIVRPRAPGRMKRAPGLGPRAAAPSSTRSSWTWRRGRWPTPARDSTPLLLRRRGRNAPRGSTSAFAGLEARIASRGGAHSTRGQPRSPPGGEPAMRLPPPTTTRHRHRRHLFRSPPGASPALAVEVQRHRDRISARPGASRPIPIPRGPPVSGILGYGEPYVATAIPPVRTRSRAISG